MQAENDLRATSGFSYDVGASEKRVEQSGRAILARQKQGETGNSHFSAHLAVALRHAGRVLIDLMPHYYSAPRIKRILGRDGNPKTIVMHAGSPEAAMELAQAQNLAETSIFDLSVGRYDVRVMAGVSYASQRQEDRELMVNALQTNPALMQLIGDLFFKTMDSPIAERIAKRLQKALPPGLQDEGQKPGQVPPEAQAQLQKAGEMIDALTKTVNALQDGIEKQAMDLASKERIAQIQAATTIAVAQSKVENDRALALLELKMNEIDQLVQIDMARLQAAATTPPASPGQPPSPAPAVPPSAPPQSPEGSLSAPVSTAPPVPVG
jgi:hypothetical protein